MPDKNDPLGICDKLDMALDDVISVDHGGGGGYGKVGSKMSDHRVVPYDLRGASGGDGHSRGVGCARVFVGNLSYSVTWQDLKDHMRVVGNVVHCDIIPQPGTALGSKGCGIVEFSTPAEAAKAIATLRDTQLKGRPIFLREDREERRPISAPKPPEKVDHASIRHRSDRDNDIRRERGHLDRELGGRGGRAGCFVYVGNLPYSATWKDLKDHMRVCGNVVHCDIIPQHGTALGSKGCGIVEYSTPAEAAKAIATLRDTQIRGRPIFLREDREMAKRLGESLRHSDKAPPPRGSTPRGCGAYVSTSSLSSRGSSRDRDSGRRSSRGHSSGGRRVFVGNLPYSVTWRDLKDFMRSAGDVVHCDIIPQPGTALGSKGCGVVEFSKRSEAERAIRTLHNVHLKNRPVFVREDREGV